MQSQYSDLRVPFLALSCTSQPHSSPVTEETTHRKITFGEKGLYFGHEEQIWLVIANFQNEYKTVKMY